MSSDRSNWVVIGLVAVSTPAALVVETGLRLAIFPEEFEEVRQWLRPKLSSWMWLGPILAAAFTGFGLWLRRILTARNIARLSQDRRTEDAVSKAEFDALMLATSAPQVPAIVATFGFMLGSALEPAAATVGVATLGVLIVGRPRTSRKLSSS